MEAVLRALPLPRDHHQITPAPNKQNKIKTPSKRRNNNITRSNNNKFISNNNNSNNNPTASSSGLLNLPNFSPSPSPLLHPHDQHYLQSSYAYSLSSSKSYQQPPLLPLPTTTNVSKIHQHSFQSPNNTTTTTTTRNMTFITPKKSSKPSIMTGSKNGLSVFSGSVSCNVVSPPPSSLPTPRFCVRSKLNCNVKKSEGSRGGSGRATHNLRPILHLQ